MTIYYRRVPVHKLRESHEFYLLRYSVQGQQYKGQNEQLPQVCIGYEPIRWKEWEALFTTSQVLLMGVSFKSQGWSISHTSQNNAWKMWGKLLVLAVLNLSHRCSCNFHTNVVCRGKKHGCLTMSCMASSSEVMAMSTTKKMLIIMGIISPFIPKISNNKGWSSSHDDESCRWTPTSKSKSYYILLFFNWIQMIQYQMCKSIPAAH